MSSCENHWNEAHDADASPLPSLPSLDWQENESRVPRKITFLSRQFRGNICDLKKPPPTLLNQSTYSTGGSHAASRGLFPKGLLYVLKNLVSILRAAVIRWTGFMLYARKPPIMREHTSATLLDIGRMSRGCLAALLSPHEAHLEVDTNRNLATLSIVGWSLPLAAHRHARSVSSIYSRNTTGTHYPRTSEEMRWRELRKGGAFRSAQ